MAYLITLDLGWAAALVDVRLVEEVNEEPQVCSQETRTEECSGLRTVAAGVAVSVVMKDENGCAIIAEDDIKDELDDLHGGKVLFPPGLNTDRRQSVIPVHEGMDDQVQGNRDPLNSRLTYELSVAKNEGEAVVVNMQECKVVALENEQNGIEQFPHLKQVINIIQGFKTTIKDLNATNGSE